MRVRRSFVFMCMAVIFTVLVWTGFFGVSAIGKESGNQKAVWIYETHTIHAGRSRQVY